MTARATTDAGAPMDPRPILVLSSQRAFEAFTGPIPADRRARFVFAKPRHAARIRAWLPDVRLVVSQSYARPEVDRWIFEARRAGKPTLLLVDGPLEWSNLHASPRLAAAGARSLFDPIIHDAVAAIGDSQSRFLASRNAGRGIVFTSYANRRIRTRLDRIGVPAAEAADRTDSAFEFDFLVTTARRAAFDEQERAALERALCRCAEALVDGGHRTLLRVFDERLERAFRVRNPVAVAEASGPFADALARARCVIGTPSSVLLEAMVHDRPTATLIFRDAPLFYPTGWLLGGFADWQASLASMLARDPERMGRQREIVREHVSEADFFAQAEAGPRSLWPSSPRPLDARDLAFENRILRQLAGWRGRLLAPVVRAFARLRRDRGSNPIRTEKRPDA